MRNFTLKQKWQQKRYHLLQRLLTLVAFAVLSSNLYAQRRYEYRLDEYDEEDSMPWWIGPLCLMSILVYLWIKGEIKTWEFLLGVAILVVLVLICLYEWFLYSFLAVCVLGIIVFCIWGDKIYEFITKLRNK